MTKFLKETFPDCSKSPSGVAINYETEVIGCQKASSTVNAFTIMVPKALHSCFNFNIILIFFIPIFELIFFIKVQSFTVSLMSRALFCDTTALREKCQNKEFFLVFIFPHLNQNKLRI